MTNVGGRNYGTHLSGENGRTLCKRYACPDHVNERVGIALPPASVKRVNVVELVRETSCLACLRAARDMPGWLDAILDRLAQQKGK